jgi:polysaccharide deacetylase 2 family uncharacterized protein YibQ
VVGTGVMGIGGGTLRSSPRIALALMLLVFAGYATTTYLRRIAEVESLQGASPQATLSIVSVLGKSGEGAAAPEKQGHESKAGNQKPDQKPREAAKARLRPHPDPMLVERNDLGMLPVIGKDGRRPWRVYARPFDRLDKRPRIAIVMTGLGISRNATQSVINTLPGPISFSFAPYADDLDAWIEKSRSNGHEALIDMPMEPLDYPRNDPGPNTLLANAPADRNIRRLQWALSRTTGYVGVATFMGANLAAQPKALKPILAELKTRGLMILDTRENPFGHIVEIARGIGLPVAANDIFVDREPTAAAIEQRLRDLERRARENGAAIALARPLPVTIKTLIGWLPDLDAHGVALAPVSALAGTRANDS